MKLKFSHALVPECQQPLPPAPTMHIAHHHIAHSTSQLWASSTPRAGQRASWDQMQFSENSWKSTFLDLWKHPHIQDSFSSPLMSLSLNFQEKDKNPTPEINGVAGVEGVDQRPIGRHTDKQLLSFFLSVPLFLITLSLHGEVRGS